MSYSVPQTKLDSLKVAYPDQFFRCEPFVTLRESHTYLHMPEELQQVVSNHGWNLQKKRRSKVLWSVAIAGYTAALLAAVFTTIFIPFVFYIPWSVTRRMRPLLSDGYGDAFVPSDARLIAKGLRAILVPLGVGVMAALVVAAINLFVVPIVYVGVPGIAMTLVSIAWYRLVSSAALDKPESPRPVLVPTTYDTPGATPEVIRGSEVVQVYQLVPDAIGTFAYSTQQEGGEPRLNLIPWDYFGGLPIVRGSTSNNHMLFVGMAGSGKTSFLKVLMGTLLPEATINPPTRPASKIRNRHRAETHQAVIYDAKTENIPLLMGHGFVPRRDLFILNPFDERAVAWDMARDIRTAADAKLLAEIFLQSNTKSEEREQHHYFRTNARRQITAVIQTFIHCGGSEPRWRLRDVVNAFSSREVLRHVLEHHPEGDSIIKNTMDLAEETAGGVYSSSTTYLDDFRILAALWHRIEERELPEGEVACLSLEEWMTKHGKSVLVLGDTRENEAVLTPLNRLVLHRLSTMMLDQRWNKHVETGPGIKERRAIILDECPQLGKLEKLGELFTQGRQYGVQVILGVQAYSQMVSVYGEHDAKTMLGQCGYKAFLKSDADTAEWASKQIGQQLERYSTKSYTTGKNRSLTYGTSETYTQGRSSGSGGGGSSSSTSYTNSRSETDGWSSSEGLAEQQRVIETVLPSEISSLPDPKMSGGISGYFITPQYPVYTSHTGFDVVEKMSEWSETAARRIGVDNTNEWLPLWTPEDYQRLGLALFSNAANAPTTADSNRKAPPLPEDDGRQQFPDLF